MKLNLMALGCAFLLALGLSSVTFAGSITDDDGDGVPNGFDNCTAPVANGPLGGNACGQFDADADGYGNACDADYGNNGVVDSGDLVGLLGKLGGSPGPSDLGCAGTVPCP
jgi:hypothetical protein